MKKTKILALAFAALALGACSNEDVVDSQSGAQWNAEGQATSIWPSICRHSQLHVPMTNLTMARQKSTM